MKQTILPNQWKDWCSALQLKPFTSSDRNRHRLYYLKGRGYVWRVNYLGMFQRGDSLKDFNRWALCDIEETNLPKTYKELKQFVEEVL